jgi:hypothetical protein
MRAIFSPMVSRVLLILTLAVCMGVGVAVSAALPIAAMPTASASTATSLTSGMPTTEYVVQVVLQTPAKTLSKGVNGNPWGYNFSCCRHITSVSGSFCRYFRCIPNFWKSTNGYVVECKDGTYSHSGGRRGACSYHRGVWRALLKH